MRVMRDEGHVINVPNSEDMSVYESLPFACSAVIKKPLVITPLRIDFCCDRMKRAMVSIKEMVYHPGGMVCTFGGASIYHCPWCGGEIIIQEE